VVVLLVCLSRGSTGATSDDPGEAVAATRYRTPAGPVGDGVYRHPAEVHTADGSYRFLLTRTRDGVPVAWEPCAPVPLVVNPDGAPAGAVALVREAAHEISVASGLDVTVVGTTDERPLTDRPLALDRYPGGFAPALVSWSDVDESPGLEHALAYADPDSADMDGTLRWVTGQVVVDTDWLAGNRADNPSLPGEEDHRSVVMHELGHLVGLDHVSSQAEVMSPGARASELGPGDRAGLWALGAGRCADG
jgi:hypothetical protein